MIMLDKVKIILSGHALAPEHAYDTDAGYDLRTPVVIVIPPRKRVLVDTQVKMDIPAGYYGRLESKSSLMLKGITSRGTIDSGYHGTIKVVLFNHSDSEVSFKVGDKITQVVFLKCETPKLEVVGHFDNDTERGNGGFGSTGE